MLTHALVQNEHTIRQVHRLGHQTETCTKAVDAILRDAGLPCNGIDVFLYKAILAQPVVADGRHNVW